MAPSAHVAVPQAVNLLDAGSLLSAFGALGIAVVPFAETGLRIGFFLPGDSLLCTAGLLCGPGGNRPVHLSLPQILAFATIGALLVAQVGYLIGRHGGRALLARGRSRKLHDGAARAEELLQRYGHAKAVAPTRFVPVVRTSLNPLAGALGVPLRVFTLGQVVGGLLWSVGLVLAGYALGSSVPEMDHDLLPIVAVVALVSLTPLAVEMIRRRGPRAPNGTAH
ncbi:DedA family protein [Streptomyces sp. NBC_01214]|uniref:DedA family protein n=1 Tax=Streptomyces sp. NBC_01214 TaxID=2903777 RepID=UPI00224D30C0|nr:DedA family protein [Streptomyces sp. NBC_01214]MCX4803520.1 DedA family protein [Streptomyces sp. NBC_01214]